MIKQLGTQAVYVLDQKSAEEFWKNKIGFEILTRRELGNGLYWLELAPRGAQSRLVLYPRSLMPDWTERKPSIVFECDDVERTYAELKDRGVEVGEAPQEMKWGKFGTFKDLDGNEFGFKSLSLE